MKRMLNAPVRAWHLMAALMVVVVLGGGAVYAKIGPSNFRPAGDFRIASASGNNEVALASTNTVVLSRGITVPAGKKADFLAFFNGEAYSAATGGYTYGTFHLDSASGTVFSPGEEWLVDQTVYPMGRYPTVAFQGYLNAVPAGDHVIYVTLRRNGVGASVFDRSLIIIANIHD